MSTKTFKSTMTDRTLAVEVYHDRPHIAIESAATASDGFFYAATDAPALALAILEAAGVESAPFDSATSVQIALGNLREHVGIETAKAKAAADWKALEGEAHALICAWKNVVHQPGEFDTWGPETQARGIKMAHAAREIHGAKS